MTEKRIYLPLMLLIGGLIFLINNSTKISMCSLLFSSLIFSVKIFTDKFGIKNTLSVVSAFIIANGFICFGVQYKFNGQIFNYLPFFSLIALGISIYASLKLYSYIKSQNSTNNSFIILLLIASCVDMFLMSGYFIQYFTLSKISIIMVTELFYKISYVMLYMIIKNLMVIKNSKIFIS